MTTNRREWIVALVVLAFGLLTVYYIIPTQVELTDDYELHSLSPAFFPSLAAWMVTFLAGILILKRFRRSPEEDEDKEPELSLRENLRVVAFFGLAFLFVLSFKYLGFPLATGISLLIFFFLQGIRPILKLFTLSAGVTVLVYAFFHFGMKVHFIRGVEIG